MCKICIHIYIYMYIYIYICVSSLRMYIVHIYIYTLYLGISCQPCGSSRSFWGSMTGVRWLGVIGPFYKEGVWIRRARFRHFAHLSLIPIFKKNGPMLRIICLQNTATTILAIRDWDETGVYWDIVIYIYIYIQLYIYTVNCIWQYWYKSY